MPPATPKMPLHTPLPNEFTGLTVNHLYSRIVPNARPAKVTITGKRVTIEEISRDYGVIVSTFCSTSCFEVVDPYKDGALVINIRHGCVDGWRMIFESSNPATLLALKDAVLRVKNDILMSHNLLMDDRCVHLDLTNRGLTNTQNARMREETTAAIPSGSLKEFNQDKKLDGSAIPLYWRGISACPAASSCTSRKCTVARMSVKAGVVTISSNSGHTRPYDAADFYPPRLVTPPSADFALFVCDNRDISSFEQALVFETDRAHSDQFRDVLMHAWMELEDGKKSASPAKRTTKKAKNEPAKMVETKKVKAAPKKTKETPAKAKAKAEPKTTKAVSRQAKPTPTKVKAAPKKVEPKKTKTGPKEKVIKKSSQGVKKTAKEKVAKRTTRSTPKTK